MPHLTFAAAALLTAAVCACAATAAAERPESQQEYWAQFDRRDWTAAIAAAERLVQAARLNAGDEPFELAEALTLLGNAQLGARDYVSAEAAYSEALEIVQQHGGAMSAKLLGPMRGMGYTLAASGRHEEATQFLEPALIVARRTYGLFDPGQQGLLRQLATSLTKVGRVSEAERHMHYLLRVGERNHGRDDPALAPLLCQVGAWYTEVGSFEEARKRFRHAFDLVTEKLGPSHIAAVEPLRGLARTYTHELALATLGVRLPRERGAADGENSSGELKVINPRYLNPEGEKALERALKIIESQPSPPRELYIETLIQLGDWRQIKHQPERALAQYRRAAALLDMEADANGSAAEQNAGDAPTPPTPLLSFPVRVYYSKPWLATRHLTTPPELVEETYVEVEFTVTPLGEVTDARVVDKNGTNRQVAEALEAIKAARFRPRFVAGEPVATHGVTNREVFRTRKETTETDETKADS